MGAWGGRGQVGRQRCRVGDVRGIGWAPILHFSDHIVRGIGWEPILYSSYYIARGIGWVLILYFPYDIVGGIVWEHVKMYQGRGRQGDIRCTGRATR